MLRTDTNMLSQTQTW